MRKYELMFIVRPTLEESLIKKVAADMKSLLEANNTKVNEVKDMGQRDLAYEINGFTKGYYFLFTVEATDDKGISEFNRIANISEDIIRHIIVKIEK